MYKAGTDENGIAKKHYNNAKKDIINGITFRILYMYRYIMFDIANCFR